MRGARQTASGPRTDRRSGLALAAAVLSAVLVAAGAPATVLPGPGEDERLLVDERVDGGHAVTVTVELDGPALYRIDLIGEPPRTASAVATGFVAFDEAGAYDGLVAVTSFQSQERQRTVVAGEDLPVPAYEAPDAGGEPLSSVLGDDEAPERACPMACASRLVQPDRSEAGTAHHGLWLGGADATRLQVVGDENVTRVEVRAGTSLNAGSEGFDDGTVNVQHQPTTRAGDERLFAGAKAMHGAQREATVEHDLYGVLGLADFKTACAGTCVGVDAARATCSTTGADCRASGVAWEGPAGASDPAPSHVLRGLAPGTYAFEVQGLADAWATPTPVVADYAWADPGEHHAYLSAADLPQPPSTR